MKLKTKEGEPLMSVATLTPDKNNLVIEGKIMDAIPIRAVLTPSEARAALKLLNFKTVVFLLTILFRKG